jgi:fumarate hydratase, class I
MAEFEFTELLPTSPQSYARRQLDDSTLATVLVKGTEFIEVTPAILEDLAYTAFKEVNFFLRTDHLAQLRKILDDPEASSNDKYVALDLLKNANVSSGGVLPMCQDTGTAVVYAKRGPHVLTDGNDAEYISKGIYRAYEELNLRYSQLSPKTLWQEVNTNNNLPAEINISLGEGSSYEFLFMAKGGGSANKSFVFQESKAILDEERMLKLLAEKIESIGTAACPPYHLAVVIGGTSAEFALKTAKLASAHYLDNLPRQGGEIGFGFRDHDFEKKVFSMTQKIGFGAQFGGKYFCHDVRVVRLARHNGSLPIAIAVSCSADRQVLASISTEGVFIEELEHDPARFIPDDASAGIELSADGIAIDLNKPMAEIQRELSKCEVGTRVMLSGPMIVARDIAHAKLRSMLDAGEKLPDYVLNHPVYYAGPAKTPEGYPTGSFGPTTGGRMDTYVEQLQKAGGSLVMLAKGNRSSVVTKACKNYGGFYLGSVGGPAARLAQDCIKSSEVIDFPELGMEAIFKIEVVDFPAFVVVDDKGNDFFNLDTSKPLMLGKTRKVN